MTRGWSVASVVVFVFEMAKKNNVFVAERILGRANRVLELGIERISEYSIVPCSGIFSMTTINSVSRSLGVAWQVASTLGSIEKRFFAIFEATGEKEPSSMT